MRVWIQDGSDVRLCIQVVLSVRAQLLGSECCGTLLSFQTQARKYVDHMYISIYTYIYIYVYEVAPPPCNSGIVGI